MESIYFLFCIFLHPVKPKDKTRRRMPDCFEYLCRYTLTVMFRKNTFRLGLKDDAVIICCKLPLHLGSEFM